MKLCFRVCNYYPQSSNINNIRNWKLTWIISQNSLRITEYFGYKDNEEDTDTSDSEADIRIPRFKKEFSWIPKTKQICYTWSYRQNQIGCCLSSALNNTISDEKKKIQSLRNRDDVIKPADIRSAFVIMDNFNNIAEAERQISDEILRELDHVLLPRIVPKL